MSPTPNGAGPTALTPQPLPLQFAYEPAALEDGRPVVIFKIASFAGLFVGFLTPEEARRIGAQLIATGDAAAKRSTLIVPRVIPPDDLAGGPA